MKNLIILLIVVALIIGGFILFSRNSSDIEVNLDETMSDMEVVTETDEPVEPEVEEVVVDTTKTVIGTSVNDNEIMAYHYGEGDKELLFVGGIHGGYEWNTSLVAYELMDYLGKDSGAIPDGYKVTVIPVLNPDGLEKVVGTTAKFSAEAVTKTLAETIPGRFNGNDVDLNRNFDCDWQEKAAWQSREVSGGSSVFSEPESQAVRSYVESHDISAAVVWYSAAGGVYTSSCQNGVLAETKTLTQVYADASGYPAKQEFDSYNITGDMVNWLAKENIPAISVLLTTHTDVEWDKNRKGAIAFLNFFTE